MDTENIRNEDLLHTAINHGWPDLVAQLLQFHDARSSGAVNLAARKGRVDILRQLIEAGMSPSGENNQALLAAVQGKQATLCVDYLIPFSDSEAKNEALCGAALQGEVALVRRLIEAGADVHTLNDHPLYVACVHGRRAVVELLLREGADPTVFTPEDIAAFPRATRRLVQSVSRCIVV